MAKATKRNPDEMMPISEAVVEYEAHRRRLGIEHPHISTETLRAYCNRGKIKGATKCGHFWLLSVRTVRAFAETNLGPGPGGVARKRTKKALGRMKRRK